MIRQRVPWAWTPLVASSLILQVLFYPSGTVLCWSPQRPTAGELETG